MACFFSTNSFGADLTLDEELAELSTNLFVDAIEFAEEMEQKKLLNRIDFTEEI